jgi:hypothetical protein
VNEKNTHSLVTAAPLLYRLYGTNTGWSIKHGFTCGDGWFGILLNLSQKIEAVLQAMVDAGTPREELPKVLQIKEKFGGLRFYMDRQSEQWTDWIREAEDAARKACERCGAPGVMHQRGFFLQTLCPKCAAAEGFRLADLESEEEDLGFIGNARVKAAPVLKTPARATTLKGEGRAAFLAARPLLLLNPRSPANVEIAGSGEALKILARMTDRMEAELKRLTDVGLAIDALPVVQRIAVVKKSTLAVDIAPGTLPAAAEAEFDAAIAEAVVALGGN